MSEIDYKTGDPAAELPRYTGIKGWGMFLIVIGWLLIFSALITGIRLVTTGKGPGAVQTQPPLLVLGTAANLLILALMMLRIGLGARKGRRWARSMIVVFSILFIVRGFFSLPASLIVFENHTQLQTAAALTATRPSSARISTATAATTLAISLLTSEVFFTLLLWYFNRRAIRAEFEQLDPDPSWTDRCPLPVLIFCGYFVADLLTFVRITPLGIATIFGKIVVGQPARIMLAAQFLVMLAAIFLCVRLRLLGWLLGIMMVVLNFVSEVAFILHGDVQRFINLTQIHATAEGAREALRIMRVALVSQTLFRAVVIVYLLFIYRYFKPPLATVAAG